MTTEEMWQLLQRYDREIATPNLEGLWREMNARFERVDERFEAMQRDNLAHFDAVYKRFDRLDAEVASLIAGLRRVEERITSLEERTSALEHGTA